MIFYDFFMIFLMIFFVFYEKTCFFMRNIYDCIYDFEKMVFVFYEIWQFLCFLFNLFCFFMIVMIFMSFSFLWCCVWFFILCFSFLNNWLENIERTITLHVFYFKHMENSKQTTTFFISHTWRTLNKHWLCIYLFI